MWEWHIPLLFFLSGCVECFRYEKKLGEKIISDIKRIVLPFFIFGFVAFIFASFYGDYAHNFMLVMLQDLFMGVRRNTFFVTQIWFLSCLFVTKLMFNIIGLIHRKSVTVVLGMLVWAVGNYFFYDDATHIFWNIDSAFHYFIYFILGFVLFPMLNKLITDEKYRYIKLAVTLIFGAYTIAVYYYLIPVYDFYTNYVFFALILGIVIFQCCLASLLVDVDCLKTLGKKTLYLCGNEGVMNYSISVLSEMIGINWVITKPISVCIKALLTILIISRFIYPWEKKLIDKVVSLI